MPLAIISGSHRQNSESERVAKFIEALLKQKKDLPFTSQIISLTGNPFPLFDTDIWEDAERWKTVWHPTREKLRKSEAFVVISPEWAGMVPAGLKNFLLLCTNHELAHKPALIVTVSSGTGGTYPVAELRMSGTKNNHLCYIPEQVIVRHVESMGFEIGKPKDRNEEIVHLRLNYALDVLATYSTAFKGIRASGVIDHKNFANGM